MAETDRLHEQMARSSLTEIAQIRAPEDVSLLETQRTGLARRVQAYRADPQPGASWSDVQQRVQGQE